jgi:perosamine synthetase
MKMIPVFEPEIGEEEIVAVSNALRKGEISGSFGECIPNFENEFSKYCGCKYGVAVTSGTTALHLAVRAAGIKQGDEVLVSASTNIATGLAVIHNNAVVIPVDSEPNTWNLNIDLIDSLVTPKTKAIIVVHLFGFPVDMDRLMDKARKYNLIVIEDCAESHGATVRGKMTGSFGDMACFSFYANKIITTGEGGMITTNNQKYAEKLRLLRNLAFTKPRFWHDVAGYNFRMTGYQAAMGIAQFKKIEFFISEKRRLARLYNSYLEKTKGLQFPPDADWARNVYWMYALRINKEFGISRDDLIKRLLNAGIETRTFFCPMNIQPCLMEVEGYRQIVCPVAEKMWADGLYLPSSIKLTEKEIKYIAEEIDKARS